MQDYYWKLVDVDTDKYTARAQLELHDGYVIRALPGSKVVYPVQACLVFGKGGLEPECAQYHYCGRRIQSFISSPDVPHQPI